MGHINLATIILNTQEEIDKAVFELGLDNQYELFELVYEYRRYCWRKLWIDNPSSKNLKPIIERLREEWSKEHIADAINDLITNTRVRNNCLKYLAAL